MSENKADSLFIESISERFKGLHWPPIDEDDAEAERLWLDEI